MDSVRNTGNPVKGLRSSPYLILKATPRSNLMGLRNDEKRSFSVTEGAYICFRPNGVKSSAPSLYVHVFKNAKSPVAVKPVPNTVAL